MNSEHTQEHTRILRAMLVIDDSIAYWRLPRSDLSGSARAIAAFQGRWFGAKSEARVRTLLGDMALRFDAYPEALEALRLWRPARDASPWICHFHTQLADPIYRRFSGEFLPERRRLGYATVDRDTVARWIQETWPDRWSAVTCLKFGSNLLAAAAEAGIFGERKDPRRLVPFQVPRSAIEYVFYVLRNVTLSGGILESVYLRSILGSQQPDLDAVRIHGLGEVQNLEWAFPDIRSWAQAQREAA